MFQISNNLKIKDLRAKGSDASEVKFFPMKKLPENIAFDHNKILKYALKRLRWKLEYTTVAFSLLPKKFTLSEIQTIYEIIFDKEFDKRNFRKKLLSLRIIISTKEKTKDVSHRPAQIYEFRGKLGQITEIL